MDSLSRAILIKGIKQGYAEGFAEGFAESFSEGFPEGVPIGELRSLFDLLKDNLISHDVAVKYSSISSDEFEKKYNAYLNGVDVFEEMKNEAKARLLLRENSK